MIQSQSSGGRLSLGGRFEFRTGVGFNFRPQVSLGLPQGPRLSQEVTGGGYVAESSLRFRLQAHV